jgi:quercetin dioxygenase-like cupin family protein
MSASAQSFAYVRPVHLGQVASLGPEERYAQPLLDHESGATTCTISYIRTPAGGGSPAGMHVHDVDQMFFVLSGTMSLEIEGRSYSAPPGNLVIFPAGVPHRNWNDGPEPTIHVAISAPLPDPDKPFARSIETRRHHGPRP